MATSHTQYGEGPGNWRYVVDGGLTSPRGFAAGACIGDVKGTGGKKRDIALLVSSVDAVAACTFTTNRVKAACLRVSAEHLRAGRIRAVVANSGNANACTGEQGFADAREMAALAAERAGLHPMQVLVASTGVIGVPLPMERLQRGIMSITPHEAGGHEFAEAIMTTDTRRKEVAIEVAIGGVPCIIAGAAKGSGMIHPQMATMLAFITTDAAVRRPFLESALKRCVDSTFNMVTIDGDTSTNDMVAVLANGMAGNQPLDVDGTDAILFEEALRYVCCCLTKEIARDGEGATKLIEVAVGGAASLDDARHAAKTVAGSSLWKAAVYGKDPNWGRVLCALGYSGATFDPNALDVWLGGVHVVHEGRGVGQPRAALTAALSQDEVLVSVDLHAGGASAVAWGCDLTERYVEINASYTT
jgi:glutamate N-acetyltransferase / amino-acid N-acetyltransferase